MTTEYKTQLQKTFRTAYDMMLKHYGANDVKTFGDAYDDFRYTSRNNPLLQDILIALYQELDRENKRVQKTGL